MQKVKYNLINCYGIHKMDGEFDFSSNEEKSTNTVAIYAKNGLMKTSFAKTFKKIQDKKQKEIRDEIFNIPGEAKITIDGKILQKKIFL